MPATTAAGDFPTERTVLARARNGEPPGNRRDTIHLEFSAVIPLREKSADKQKSSLPAPEKQIPICSRERRFQPPSEGSPDKADCACSEKGRPLRALLNVERYRAQLRFANTPRPRCVALPREKQAANQIRLLFEQTLQPPRFLESPTAQSNAAARR